MYRNKAKFLTMLKDCYVFFCDRPTKNEAALNAIDVGSFLGLCLAGLSQAAGVKAASIHLVGHSLGAHLVGRAGRAFTEATGQSVGRVTGEV